MCQVLSQIIHYNDIGIKYMKYKIDKLSMVLIVIFLIAIGYMFYSVKLKEDRWSDSTLEKRYTIGKVIRFNYYGKGGASTFRYNFNYYIKDFEGEFIIANIIGFDNKEHVNHGKITSNLLRLSNKELNAYVGKRFYVKFIVD